MQCSICDVAFNDGVQCVACKKHLDFGCAQITEIGWRKLGVDRRATWRCAACKSSPIPSPLPTTGDEPYQSASLESVLAEIRDLKRQLLGLPSLIQDIKTIKDELRDIKQSNDFLSNRLDEFSARTSELQERVIKVEKLNDTVTSLELEIRTLKSQYSEIDQRSRLNNIEIKGVPIRKDENLFSVVESICKAININIPRQQINFLHRAQMHGSKEKYIIVGFLNRYIKEDFVAAARAFKNLSASDIGLVNATQRIYVNDHLNSNSKMLLNRTKSKAKDKNYSYVWVKHGKIHVRKNDTSPVFIIGREEDLNRIA